MATPTETTKSIQSAEVTIQAENIGMLMSHAAQLHAEGKHTRVGTNILGITMSVSTFDPFKVTYQAPIYHMTHTSVYFSPEELESQVATLERDAEVMFQVSEETGLLMLEHAGFIRAWLKSR